MERNRVLITGGVSGLGRELALHYVRRGTDVLVLDQDRSKGAELASDPKFKEARGQILFAFCDLAVLDAASIDPALSAVLNEGIAFSHVYCNAGISNSEDFLKTSRELDQTILNVNVIGHMQLLKALLRRGRIARKGRLVLIASASLFLPFPIAIAYAASKAAVHGLAYALDSYLRGEKISVSTVYPGPLKTPHAEKYYDKFNEGKGAAPAGVARRIASKVEQRRREIHPDFASVLFNFLYGFSPGLLSWIMHAKYKSHLYSGAVKH